MQQPRPDESHAREGLLRTNIGNTVSLDDAVAALNSTDRAKGKTIISVRRKAWGRRGDYLKDLGTVRHAGN